MSKEEAEKKFEEYRKYLLVEVRRLADYISLYQRLHERRADRLKAMNIARAFFEITVDALFSSIILWIDKLFDERGERGLFNFLTFIENNRIIVEVAEFQRRKKLPDGHWLLEQRQPVTFSSIQKDRAKIAALVALPSVRLRRDKFHAHFDKTYFFDREKISTEAPLKWDDLSQIVQAMGEIVNRYSAAYDGVVEHLTLMNVNDIDHLLDRLHGEGS